MTLIFNRPLFFLWILAFIGLAFALLASAQAEESITFELMTSELEQEVGDLLANEGAGETLDVHLTGKYPRVLHKSEYPIGQTISELEYDSRSLRWNATLNIHDGSGKNKTLTLYGRYANLIDVPMLKQRLYSDDVIDRDDIVWTPYPEHRLRKQVILSERELLGRSPRRVISEGRPIRADEVEQPPVVSKGDLIHITFQQANLEIRTVGEAMEDGALDKMIRIRNPQSGIIIHATVTAPGTATVRQLMQLSQK